VQGSRQHPQEPGKGQGVSGGVGAGLHVPPCCPCSLGSVSPTLPCPRCPTAEPSPAGPARAGTPEGRAAGCRALITMDVFSSRDLRPRIPGAEDASSPRCPGCQGQRGLRLAGCHHCLRWWETCRQHPWHCTAAAARTGPEHTSPA